MQCMTIAANNCESQSSSVWQSWKFIRSLVAISSAICSNSVDQAVISQQGAHGQLMYLRNHASKFCLHVACGQDILNIVNFLFTVCNLSSDVIFSYLFTTLNSLYCADVPLRNYSLTQCGRDSILLWWQCNTLCYVLPVLWMTSCFHTMDVNRPESKMTHMFHVVCQVVDWRRSLPFLQKKAVFHSTKNACVFVWLQPIWDRADCSGINWPSSW